MHPQGLILLMPTRGTIAIETHVALSQNMDGVRNLRVTVERKPVDEARNVLAGAAQRIAKDDPLQIGPSNYLALWIDDDAWWPPGTITEMLGTMAKDPTIDLLCANFCVRAANSSSAAVPKGVSELIERANAGRAGFYKVDMGILGWQQGAVNEIEGCGFHFVMHKVSMFDAVGPEPFTPKNGNAEDETFTKRAHHLGFRLACHSGLNVAHIDVKSGLAFIPHAPALQVEGNRLILATPERLAAFVPDEQIRSSRHYGEKIDAFRREFDVATAGADLFVLEKSGSASD